MEVSVLNSLSISLTPFKDNFFLAERCATSTAKMSGKAKETASNTMEAIRDKMTNLKNAKEAAADLEKSLQNRIAELNKVLEERDHEIIVIGKKIMKIENSLDDTVEKLEAATVGLEEAEKQQLVNEEEVSALQHRSSLLDDDVTRSESRLQVESAKLAEAAAAAEAVEIQRIFLVAKSFVNDERMDSLEENIAIASDVALKSTRNAEEKIRDLTMNPKFTEIQAAAAEREAAKLQQELDLLITDLTDWKDKYGEICVELEQTFNEMAGY